MSNRTIDQANELAEYKLSHEAQIDALTRPGLTDEERVRLFAEAAGFSERATRTAQRYCGSYYDERNIPAPSKTYTPGMSVWEFGGYPKSLFADLPLCKCPVLEGLLGATMDIVADPTEEGLGVFSRHQLEARFGKV